MSTYLGQQERLPRADERTPEDWRDVLMGQLAARAKIVAAYESYYDGEHPLQFATSKFREAFGTLFGAFADNWCQIVVDAAVERLRVVGFQQGGNASDAAWAIWQANKLDVESVIAHTEAGKCGRSYLLVDPNGEDGPEITVEHAGQMIVACEPGDRHERLAALKRWLGDDGYLYATLYLPDVVFKWESSDRVQGDGTMLGQVQWVARTDDEPEGANTLGVVPVIPMENKPGLLAKAHSDLEPAIPLQNAVNKLCTDLIVASEYGAFPQRVATGVDVPKDPETGQPIASEELKAAMSRLWTFKDPQAAVSSLAAADLSNFVKAIEMFMSHLAAQTRTPPHYLLAGIVNASGDALSVAEAGLVSKCKSKILFFSDPWEEAMALALDGADSASLEAVWANPERLSQAQLTDAAVKKKTLGVPLEFIWAELGYTPEQIKEMKKLQESEQQQKLEQAAILEEATAKYTLQAGQDLSTPATPAAGAPQPAVTATEQQPPQQPGGTSG